MRARPAEASPTASRQGCAPPEGRPRPCRVTRAWARPHRLDAQPSRPAGRVPPGRPTGPRPAPVPPDAAAEGCFPTAAHMRWFWEQYLGPGGDGRHPPASPLRADPAGLPPAHLVVAGCDPLLDDGRAYRHRLTKSGIRSVLDSHPGMIHGFMGLAGVLPQACEALARLGGAINSAPTNGKTFGEAGGGAG
ncbi:alpha/beta hydrolase fold domain-containing protein [Streptomyces sp. NPDC090021]|uniref:alpha/beta hydrolase fold domain-containing protein n=1 Tax=Streptomyces sp. NPDC090021 TaxID=3365919 RepID=UPI00382DD472